VDEVIREVHDPPRRGQLPSFIKPLPERIGVAVSTCACAQTHAHTSVCSPTPVAADDGEEEAQDVQDAGGNDGGEDDGEEVEHMGVCFHLRLHLGIVVLGDAVEIILAHGIRGAALGALYRPMLEAACIGRPNVTLSLWRRRG